MQKGWLSFILGIWLIISAFIQTMHIPGNMTIVGLLIAIDGFFVLRKWEGSLLGIFGMWLLFCGILFGLVNTLNFLIIGVLVTFFSFLCIYHRHLKYTAIHQK
jgi:hypothetical protein